MPSKFQSESRLESKIEHIVLLRHGETVGGSSVRFYGATDVMLSGLGADQAAAAAKMIARKHFDLVVASPLQRAWRSALIAAPGRRIRLEDGLREIDFGCWEGLTRPEIEVRDPMLYAQWRERGLEFDYPEGDRRQDFSDRVLRCLSHLLALPAASMLIVAHKGSVRTIAEELCGSRLAPGQPELGGLLELTRGTQQAWKLSVLTR